MKKLNDKTLKFIEGCITGDLNLTERRSGPDLIAYFSKFGFQDKYASGFPSRRYYVNEKLQKLDGTEIILKIVLDIFNPINFIGNKGYPDIIQSINEYLLFDELELVVNGKDITLKDMNTTISQTNTTSPINKPHEEIYNNEYVEQQYKKCKKKIIEEDYDGAITNARTLLEATFGHIYHKVYNKELPKTGDLIGDFKKIKDCLDFTGEQRTDDALKALGGSISNIIGSIDNLSNSMGDRHRRTIQPRPYQAEFIVNSAIVLNNYILGIFKFNLHTVDNILEEIRPLFNRDNVYWYYLDIDKIEKYNEIHSHPIAISLKSKLTALKGKEVIKYLIETLDLRSWEASGRFFGTMILLIDYLSLEDINIIFDKTVVSFKDQAINLRRFLQNIKNHKSHILSEKHNNWLDILTILNIYQLSSFIFGNKLETNIEKVKKVGKGVFVASLLEQYYGEDDLAIKIIKKLKY